MGGAEGARIMGGAAAGSKGGCSYIAATVADKGGRTSGPGGAAFEGRGNAGCGWRTVCSGSPFTRRARAMLRANSLSPHVIGECERRRTGITHMALSMVSSSRAIGPRGISSALL